MHHIQFKGAIFTNFSQDHLDYHKNMKSYLNAKFLLFKEILRKKSTIISDITIPQFKLIKKIAEENTFQLLDISSN